MGILPYARTSEEAVLEAELRARGRETEAQYRIGSDRAERVLQELVEDGFTVQQFIGFANQVEEAKKELSHQLDSDAKSLMAKARDGFSRALYTAPLPPLIKTPSSDGTFFHLNFDIGAHALVAEQLERLVELVKRQGELQLVGVSPKLLAATGAVMRDRSNDRQFEDGAAGFSLANEPDALNGVQSDTGNFHGSSPSDEVSPSCPSGQVGTLSAADASPEAEDLQRPGEANDTASTPPPDVVVPDSGGAQP